MKDSRTGGRIVVNSEGDAGPYIVVPPDQIDNVKKILKDNGFPYSVDPNGPSSDGDSMDAVFNLGSGADADAIQDCVDSVE